MFDQEDDDIDYDDVTTPSSKELNKTPLETFNRVEKNTPFARYLVSQINQMKEGTVNDWYDLHPSRIKMVKLATKSGKVSGCPRIF